MCCLLPYAAACVALARLCHTLAAVAPSNFTLPTLCAGLTISNSSSSGAGGSNSSSTCSAVLCWLFTSHLPDVVLAGVWVTLAVDCLLELNQVAVVVWGAATMAWLLLASALLAGRGSLVGGGAAWGVHRESEAGAGYHPIKG
jgi:hypothetical protein